MSSPAEGSGSGQVPFPSSAESTSALETYDYTEGASAIDIADVLSRPRTRRDSQVGSAYEGEEDSGAVFDGPANMTVPSSVSSMHHERMFEFASGRERRSESRRHSMDYAAAGRRLSVDRSQENVSRRLSTDVVSGEESQPGEEDRLVGDEQQESPTSARSRPITPGSARVRPRRQTSDVPDPVESPRASGVFGNLASYFGRAPSAADEPVTRGRRPSGVRRKSSDASRRSRVRSAEPGSEYAVSDQGSDEEQWGYFSNEEDDDADEYASEDTHELQDFTSNPPSPSASLPLLTGQGDPIFGDTRINMYDEREPSLPPPPGPPSRQSVYIADEDTTMRFTGYEPVPWKSWLWFFGCCFSLGGLALIGRWLPGLWLRSTCQEKGFKTAKNGVIVVESPFADVFLSNLKKVDYPYPAATVFNGLSSPSSTVRPSGSNTPVPGNKAPVNGNAASAELLSTLQVTEYRHSRFVLNPTSGLFMMLREWRDPAWKSIKAVQSGLTSVVRDQRKILFGDNVIDVKGKSIGGLLVDEVLHPFYVFQVASIILWSIDDYYYYAFCIALISLISIGTTLIETKRTIERMREMSRFSCPVRVFIDGKWTIVESTQLVPGDIVDLITPTLAVFPADMLLLSGDAIVNESMLTGESVPVSKIPSKDSTMTSWRDGNDIDPTMAKSFLYTGTRIIRVRPGNLGDGSEAYAVVVRTGFDTTKGALIRSMLFPKPMGFKFYRDSMRFIGVLACIAGVGFLASSVKFIELGVPWSTMFVRALDLITIVVPPALPATLSIGTSFSIGRLRKLGIFCISPNRVNVAGKINVVCFDKTGTLTEDGLDVLGVRALDRTGGVFGELISEVVDLPLGSGKATLLYALATCHALKSIDGEILGDPLDAKMFEWTGWTLEEGKPTGIGSRKPERPSALVQTVVRPPGTAQFKLEDALKSGKHAHFLELGVIRVFEFMSSLRRMSVIVKRLRSSSMEIYVKGAPEVMADICEKDSFPADYEDLLAYYTKNGFRVIALAGRTIDGLSWLKAQRLKREQAEAGLRFLGLIIFENKLKPGTTPAIEVLRAAHLGLRMVTGDNPRTAISVARECGLVNVSSHIFYPTFTYGDSQSPDAKLDWSSVDDEQLKLDVYSLKPLTPPHHHTVEDEIGYQDYSMAVTGDVFRWMINYAPLETLHRMLVKAQVYARMSPDEKHELVERLQSLGYTVAFCGDGANDCGALKAADVGLSLSEAEASVAAPFTSRIPDISCMIEVIREGRAALVTSFSCFKYMALYSIIQFTSITLLYSFASTLGDFQFLYIDLFIIIPVAVAMGRTLPYPDVHPKRPTASLVSKKVLASIIGQIILTSGFQFWAFFWVRSQPWYEPPEDDPQHQNGLDFETSNYENTALFLVSSFQYIFIAAVFSIGPPYRRQLWSNVVLMLCLIVLGAFSTLVLIDPPTSLSLLLDLLPIPLVGKLTLLVAVMLNVVVCSAFEQWGASHISDFIGLISKTIRNHSSTRRLKEGKAYKAVEGGMRRSLTD